jgi:hypothetical protein
VACFGKPPFSFDALYAGVSGRLKTTNLDLLANIVVRHFDIVTRHPVVVTRQPPYRNPPRKQGRIAFNLNLCNEALSSWDRAV